MPESVRVILRIIDNPKHLQKLISVFGGTQIRVPYRKIPENNLLQEVLGDKAMRRFMEAFGGTEIYIPRCKDFLCRIRNAKILQEYKTLIKKGNSNRSSIDYLAREYEISSRHIRNLLKVNPWDIKSKDISN